MGWISTGSKGIETYHEISCRSHSGGRCRCNRSYRARVKNAEGKWRWSESVASEDLALALRQQNRDGRTAEALASKPGKAFNALADEWFALARAGAVTKKGGHAYSKGTLTTYASTFDGHARPEIGKKDSAKLSVVDWQLWLDALVRKGYKRNSISVTLNCVRAIYRWACSPTRMLLPMNATRGLELPAHDEVKRDRVAEPAEAKALLAALVNGDKVAFGLGLYAGLRSVEREPLDWTDVDLKANRMKVRISKSEAGKRSLPIIPPLRAILLAEHMRQGRPTTGLVCRGPKGGVPDRDSLMSRALKAWEAEGLKPIGLHETRHSFITSMAQAGIPIHTLSVLAGHEDVKTTLEKYSHLYPGHEDEAGRLLTAFFDPKPEPTAELDSLSREDLLALVRDLRASSMTHIVTHDSANVAERTL